MPIISDPQKVSKIWPKRVPFIKTKTNFESLILTPKRSRERGTWDPKSGLGQKAELNHKLSLHNVSAVPQLKIPNSAHYSFTYQF